MIQDWKILWIVKGSIFLLLFSQNVFALKFNAEDRRIGNALLDKFSRRCSSISNNDRKTIQVVRDQFNQSKKNKRAFQCISSEMTQIESIQVLYSKLCTKVRETAFDFSDTDLGNLVVSTERYKNGIRPFVQRMNDCLSNVKGGEEYVLQTTHFKWENRLVLERLSKMKVKSPFRANRVTFR